MDLVEVDVVRAEPPQAVLKLPPQPRRRGVGEHAALVPLQTCLGGNEERIAPAMRAHRLADNLLGAAATVDGRGIDEVDAAFDGAQAGGNRRVLGHRSPLRSADGPGSQADPRDFHPRNCRGFHAEIS